MNTPKANEFFRHRTLSTRAPAPPHPPEHTPKPSNRADRTTTDMMTPRPATLLAAACVAASLALAPVSAQDVSSAPADYNIGKDACIFEGTPDLLLDVARSNEDFSTLMAAIDSVPELAPAFGSKAEKLTILAPTNDAFETFFFKTRRDPAEGMGSQFRTSRRLTGTWRTSSRWWPGNG